MNATIFFLLIVSSFFPKLAFASSQPQIFDVSRIPLSPPPDYSVNITCTVLDKYGLTNVSLYFIVNGGTLDVVRMLIIDGDYYNGTYCAQIPPESNNTLVEYYVMATDSIGYVVQSPKERYQVSYDRTHPKTVANKIIPLGSPVLPTENVVIDALVTDEGSGVKDATLFFGVGDDPYNMIYEEEKMIKTGDEDYNCTFMGFIHPYPNGTMIHYFVIATDKANNTEQGSTRYQYFVMEAPNSRLTVSVNVLGLFMENLTATINITVEGLLPAENEPNSFNIWVSNGVDDLLVDSPFYVAVNSSFETQRFYYRSVINQNLHLMGSPNDYPFETYFLNLTLKVLWSPPNLMEFSGAFFGDYHLLNVWGYSPGIYTYNTVNKDGYPEMITTILFKRSILNWFPVVILIIVLFLVLGATMFVESRASLNERVTIFLAILIFTASFFFSLSSMVPYRYGLTIAELLVLSLVLGSGLFTVGSFLSKAVSERFDHLYFNVTTQRARVVIRHFGTFVDAIFVGLLFYLMWLFGILDNGQIPMLMRSGIVVGVFYGLLVRILMPLISKSIEEKPRSRSSETQMVV